MEDILYRKFLTLSDNKKLDYLYTFLVEDNLDALTKKYGVDTLHIVINEDFVIMSSESLKSIKRVKDTMIMDGMILVNQTQKKSKGLYVVTYEYEGTVGPICLN